MEDRRTGMPIPPFFTQDENGDMSIMFNGSHIEKETLLKAKKCLDLFLKETSDSDIKVYNMEIDEYWNNEVKHSYQKKPKIPEKGHIYILKSLSLYKIGRAKNIDGRLKSYRTENPHGIEVVFTAPVENYIQVEKDLLKMYRDKLKNGKEWFSLDSENIADIIKFLNTKKI